MDHWRMNYEAQQERRSLTNIEHLERKIKSLESENKQLQEKIDMAVDALEYYSFQENHVTQAVFNKELRKDIYASGVYFCDESGKRARACLQRIKDGK